MNETTPTAGHMPFLYHAYILQGSGFLDNEINYQPVPNTYIVF